MVLSGGIEHSGMKIWLWFSGVVVERGFGGEVGKTWWLDRSAPQSLRSRLIREPVERRLSRGSERHLGGLSAWR